MSADEGNCVEHFVKFQPVGEGTYGVVFRAKNKKTGEVVAMKKIKLGPEEEGIPAAAVREVSLLKSLQHPNILQLKDVLLTDGGLYLVCELLWMDLRKYLTTYLPPHQEMDRSLIKTYTQQILQALAYCHRRRIFHRDLKPSNLLLTGAGVIKLADFGLARAFGTPVRESSQETQVVSLWYRAPELLLGFSDYSCPVDLWSLGAVLAEMLTKQPVFRGMNRDDQLQLIFRSLGSPTELTWPEVFTSPVYQALDLPVQVEGEEPFEKLFDFRRDDEQLSDVLSRLFVLNPRKRTTAVQELQRWDIRD